MPSAKRHDLSELPYSPTIWQRIAGPWSITLRAYLWTAPLAIFTQPVVEPNFWNNPENFWLWIVNAIFGYLAFGIFIWLGKLLLNIRRNSGSANIVPVIAVAVIASMARSLTIGTLLEPLGLQGVTPVERLPFGAFLGFAWVVTSSLIMDTKYRFKFHLDEVVADQRALLTRIQNVQIKIFNKINGGLDSSLNKAHRQLQQAIREIAILSNSKSTWADLVPQLRVATLQLALSAQKESWTAEKDFNELKSSWFQAIREITTKPLMSLPIVFIATAVVTFFGGIRLYPIEFVLISLTIGLLLHLTIILITRLFIQKQSQPSSFPYAVMLVAIFLTSITLPIFPEDLGYDLLSMRGIALAATLFEIIWLVSSGYVLFNQNQRKRIIASAQIENERLKDACEFLNRFESDFEKFDYDPIETLDLISREINRARLESNYQSAALTLEFSSILFNQISELLSNTDETSIEKTLERLENISQGKAEILWTITGSDIPDSLQPRISAALELCVSKAMRHGAATVVSIDVRGGAASAEFKVTDNGHEHDDGGVGLGVEILLELSGNTWLRERSGGLNIVTAQFS